MHGKYKKPKPVSRKLSNAPKMMAHKLLHKQPQPGVSAWFVQRPASLLYLSVLTLGELRKGIDGVQDDARKWALSDWLQKRTVPVFLRPRVEH